MHCLQLTSFVTCRMFSQAARVTSHPRKKHVGQNDSQLGHNFQAHEKEWKLIVP